MQLKYRNFTTFYHNQGGKWSIGYSATLPLPPNDKMKKSNNHHTYQKK